MSKKNKQPKYLIIVNQGGGTTRWTKKRGLKKALAFAIKQFDTCPLLTIYGNEWYVLDAEHISVSISLN
jgi:hypothetical protein